MMAPFSFLHACVLLLPVTHGVAVQEAADPPTWNGGIATIIMSNCTDCHRKSGAAPFTLVSYEDAKKHARQIKRVTASGFMPPWLVDQPRGVFKHERGLSPEQVELIGRWADAGAPEGESTGTGKVASKPATAQWPPKWADIIVEPPEAWSVPAEGIGSMHVLVGSNPRSEQRWVRRIGLKPTAPRAIHAAAFLADTTGAAVKMDEGSDGPGYEAMGDIGASPSGELGAWGIGMEQFELPGTMAMKLPADSDLVMELHYVPIGRTLQERPAMALDLVEPGEPVRQVVPVMMGSLLIDIPAGDSDYSISDFFTLPVTSELVGLLPKANFLCRRIEVTALVPGEPERILLEINRWDPNFKFPLLYREPVTLPEGTMIRMEYTYDNSSSNPRNPWSTPRRTGLGLTNVDELGMLLLWFAPLQPDGVESLERAHRLELVKRLGLHRDWKRNRKSPPAREPDGDVGSSP